MSLRFSTQIAQLKAGASFREVLTGIARSGVAGLRIVKTAALDFIERVLPHYEAKFPGDLRPRAAIEVARRYLRGEATIEELKAAAAAADDAADDAAAAADAAAWAAADAAAWAAHAVAWAIWATTYAHNWAAAAADDAARAAARAAWSDAYADAERAWQREHLIKLLEAAE